MHDVLNALTESCEGKGHHFKSWAGPLSIHRTRAHLITPKSFLFENPDWVGLSVQICMQAGAGRFILTPISGECEAVEKGATAKYCV